MNEQICRQEPDKDLHEDWVIHGELQMLLLADCWP